MKLLTFATLAVLGAGAVAFAIGTNTSGSGVEHKCACGDNCPCEGVCKCGDKQR